MELNVPETCEILEMLGNLYKNIELKDFKIYNDNYMRHIEFIFDIKGINSDVRLSIDLKHVESIDQLFNIIKSF